MRVRPRTLIAAATGGLLLIALLIGYRVSRPPEPPGGPGLRGRLRAAVTRGSVFPSEAPRRTSVVEVSAVPSRWTGLLPRDWLPATAERLEFAAGSLGWRLVGKIVGESSLATEAHAFTSRYLQAPPRGAHRVLWSARSQELSQVELGSPDAVVRVVLEASASPGPTRFELVARDVSPRP